MSELLISVDPFIIRSAIVENGKLELFVIKRRNNLNSSIVGNVYKGVVKDVVPKLGAAFVDIGIGKNAFLCIDKHCVEYAGKSIRHLKQGDEIMVQVFKPMASSKGAKLTTNITLAGNYLVLLKDSNFLGVSKQILDKHKHKELKSILEECREKNIGFIARTASKSASKDEMLKEAEYLKSIFKEIKRKFDELKAPALLYEEPQIPIKVIRDYCDESTERVVIDERGVFKDTVCYLEKTNNRCRKKLELFDRDVPIFKYFGVEDEVEKLYSNVVKLKSGGYLVIEKTEAFFAIDVNAGGYHFFSRNAEESMFKVNLEAALEIFRQMNLRDLGGLIVVDFIDMEKDEHKERLQKILNELAKKDKRKTFVGKISELGIVEISRRKSNTDIFDEMFEKCPICYSGGLIKGVPIICSEIYRKIKYSSSKRFRLKASFGVLDYFCSFAKEFKDRVEFVSKETCNPEEYVLEVVE